jgi:multiple sugar transport system permease protein
MAGLLVAAGLLCGAGTAQPDASPTDLRVWVIWRNLGLEAALHKFENEYPAYHIVRGFHTGVTGTGQQKLLTAIAGGDPPDLLIFDRFSVGEWAVRKALTPLRARIEGSARQEVWAGEVVAAAQSGKPQDALMPLEHLRKSLAEFPGSQLLDLVDRVSAAIRSGAPALELLPLAESLRARCDGIHEAEHYPACWQEASYTENGRTEVYAVPMNADDRALFYNEDLLERAGYVDEQGRARPPRDWDELREYMIKLTEYDAKGNITRLGFLPHSPNYGNSWLYLYGWQNGGEFMSPDGRTCTLDDPRIEEALQYMVGLFDAVGGIEKVSAFETGYQGGELDPFLTGKVVMKIDGDWFTNVITEFGPNLRFGVTPAPPPRGRSPITWSGGFSWAIPAGAKHPAASFELIRFLLTERMWIYQAEVNARFFRSRGRAYVPMMSPMPAINAWYEEHLIANNPDLPQRVRQCYPLFAELMNVSLYRPVTPVGTYLWIEHMRAAEKAFRHSYTPAEALERGRRAVQQQLDIIYQDTGRPKVNWAAVALVSAMVLLAGAALLFWRGGRWTLARRWLRPESQAGLFFASPWLAGFALFTGGPIVVSLVYSFCRYDVLSPALWVGFENYRQLLFDDPLFWRSLLNTAYMMIGIPLGMAAGLGIAMLLDTRVRGLKVYRTLFYLPAIVPMVASSVLWIWVLNPTNGLVNSFLRMFGVADPPLWLQSSSWLFGSKAAIILMGLWGAGSGMVVWLAGLKGIPAHLYEAAEIDGAGPIRRFFHVTLPMLSPYIFFNLVMGIIGTMQMFTQAYIMTLGGPDDSTMFYAYYLFNNAFNLFNMGYASAMAWILLVAVCGLTLFQLWLSKRWVYYGGE